MRRHASAALISLLVGLAAAGCSSSGAKAGQTTSTTASAAPATVPAPFTGSVDAFYDPPSPLPAGKPGQLIRIQPVSSADGMTTVRVMYHSIDAAKRDQPVTGIVSYPTATAPAGGWPVVATAPGTVGLDTHCGLSRLGQPAPAYGVNGVHVLTDYIGMVKGQRQRYLSGPSEAHSVIDAVRAARNLPDAHAGKRWVALGHSQGGHSALFTNQLAASYAPELDLLGTAVGAPASMLTHTYGPADVVIPRMVELMAVFGIAADHPDLDPADYVGPKVIAGEDVLTSGCLDDIIGAFAGLPADQVFVKDPTTTEPAKSVVLANDPGKVKAPSPLLVFEGTKDNYVVPARVTALMDRLCSVGQVTEEYVIEGADHGTELTQGAPRIDAWIAGRFAGDAPVNSCTAKAK